jgi:histidyl-tRNA synthetase
MAELSALVGEAAAGALEATLMAPVPDVEALRAAHGPAVERLERILAALRELFPEEPQSFVLAPSLMRGFDYYTGPVFELHHPRLAIAMGGGGRYDRLTEKFGGRAVPACGGSIGFERLLLIMEESGQVPAGAAPDLVVTVFSDDLRLQSLQLAARLRADGLRVDVYPGTGKLKAQFKYADQKKAAFALVLGPDEAAQGVVKLKDMRSGEEAALAPVDVASRIRGAMAEAGTRL